MHISLILAILLLAIVCGIWSIMLRRRTGLPWAPITYRDTDAHQPEKALFARRIGLTGKPDYILELRAHSIPVEVKPGRIAHRPYESDLMQLAAYCLLIEETSGVTPPYGLLRYAEHTFRLDYTPHVRERVLSIVTEMRDLLEESDCARSHNDVYRCRSCGFFDQCDDALA